MKWFRAFTTLFIAPSLLLATSSPAEPCRNFHEYSCISGSQKTRLDSESNRSFFELQKTFLKNLKVGRGLRQQNLKALYGACLNSKERTRFEKEYAASTLRFMKGLTSIEKFQTFLGSQLLRGEEFSPLLFGPIPNLEDSTVFDLYFVSAWLTLPDRTYYEREDGVHELIDLVKSFFEALKEPNSQQRAESVVQFQIDVSKTTLLPVEWRDRASTLSSISREEADKKWPGLKLKEFLAKIPSKIILRNISPENFNWLQDSFSKVPIQVYKDAYLFHLLSEHMERAYPDYYKKLFSFRHKYFGGPEKRASDEEECSRFISERYQMELDHEILPTAFPRPPRDQIEKIVEAVRKSLMEAVLRAPWLSETGKKGASDKLQNLILLVSHPRSEKDWGFLPKKSFSPLIHYENIRSLNRLAMERKVLRLSAQRNTNEWETGPLSTKIFYAPAENRLVVPIGVLRLPVYDASLSPEAIMGSFGSKVARELGRAIDDKGSRLDSRGKLVRWMTDQDLQAFGSRTAKLEEPLKNADFISNFIGVSTAYQTAFRNDSIRTGNQKEFFLQFARTQCEESDPEKTNNVLKHLKEFQEAFACKDGTEMTMKESDRIKIW